MAIIVATSNYAEESYCEKVMLRYVHPFIANIYCNKLNSALWEGSETFYKVRSDDYIPWRGMFDLVGEPYTGED